MAYREFHPLPALADAVVCTWERTVPMAGEAPVGQRVLPDACVDLVWRNGNLWTAGPDTEAFMSPLVPGETIVGIRFRPGAAGALLGLPAKEIRDARVPVDALWRNGGELVERLATSPHSKGRRALLERALLARRADAELPDPLVAGALRLLGRPGSRVRSLGAALAISERQLLRRFEAAVGYGPKVADRVLRFQRFVALAPDGDALARLAAELGYSDQSHLTRDCVDFSGMPPTQLLATLR